MRIRVARFEMPLATIDGGDFEIPDVEPGWIPFQIATRDVPHPLNERPRREDRVFVEVWLREGAA